MLWENGKRSKVYRDSLIMQTMAWMEGVSIHNPVSNECCFDFSCCRPDMAISMSKRQEVGARELARWTEEDVKQ